MKDKTCIGVIGCGNISGFYFDFLKTFKTLQVTACTDLDMDKAGNKAAEHDIRAVSVDEMLSDKTIGIVINLTVPKAHTEVNLQVLNAGKHVYCEKPLAINRADAAKTVTLAREKNLLAGCAPDTFLGGGLQTCRKLLDEGVIGRPVSGTAFMMCHGHEGWHPNPGFYYIKGGGPMFDMGPYYLTALVHMLGPVRRVCASTSAAFKERIAESKEIAGQRLPVQVPTHYAGVLDFHNGAVVSLVMSFDVWRHGNHCIEIHGESGSMQVPDPNTFGGPVLIAKRGEKGWNSCPLTYGYTENMRGVGVADMVDALRTGRKHRCHSEMAFHVLDVISAFEESSESGRHVNITSTCERPEPLPLNLSEGHTLA